MDMTVQSDIHHFIKWATAKRVKTLNEKIANNLFLDYSRFFNVVPPGIEPGTQGSNFSLKICISFKKKP